MSANRLSRHPLPSVQEFKTSPLGAVTMDEERDKRLLQDQTPFRLLDAQNWENEANVQIEKPHCEIKDNYTKD